MLYMILELIVGFIVLFLVTKILGKVQISQLSPFYFVSAIVLGELLGNAVYDKEVGLLSILSALILWGLMILTVAKITTKFPKTRSLLEGNPSIVIRNGVVDRKELKKNNLDLNQLQNLIRHQNVFSIRKVAYAILETDGRLTVLKQWNDSTPTRADLNLPPQPVNLPVTLIIDGKILRDNLQAIGWTEQRLQSELRAQGVKKVEDVFFSEWLEGDGLHVVPLEAPS
ncbi:uncharacterized membrane protein YcaP (DUF421 family) [Melghirimyces profundicolus]|uniref:Uncharacterized membrane protein YcaP (DUF421 family) n=1 Tax=Melghirimyces profundicolus TaxID=1242148 RepID=A0A2T6C7U6_9BACL|nr:DUF421 domain-containing protein [Melghirimyces profundicolus]PTX64391.1 uncharacterized membrane protein YcaP (DUF421 family) [Melghirimyces profundicolus]